MDILYSEINSSRLHWFAPNKNVSDPWNPPGAQQLVPLAGHCHSNNLFHTNPQKPPLRPPGTPAALPRLSALVQPCRGRESAESQPSPGLSPSPDTAQLTREPTQPPLCCSPHPAPPPPAPGLQGVISATETAFFPTKTVSLQLKRCWLDAYRNLWKKWTAGNLSWNSNANSNNANKKKTSTISQMFALNDSSKEIYIFIWV